MVKTLGNQNNCYHQMPFAMFFAVEPAFTSISEEAIKKDFRYNPTLQINDESRFGVAVGRHPCFNGSTSMSIIKRTTASLSSLLFNSSGDEDSIGDERQ
ncbi:hypothetical protein SPLC1_S420150 [Arthrospira platensis C1]|nr:hypothetical protein SPLC1_S420150 [Arthrospira platensis C1]UWU47817.1 hypothetical protein APLC1_2589 [Arthrospira platensis C1]